MLKIAFSLADNSREFPTSKHYRLMGAIAALVLISLLSSAGGSPIVHSISNSWEGFIWGIADPVIGLDRLAGIVAIGLLSAKFVRGAWISLSFVLAALSGQLIHLCGLNIPGAEIAISICTIICGVILVLPKQIAWLTCIILSVTAGLSQGYGDSQAIISVDVLTIVTYITGVIFTQTIIITSARKIGAIISQQTINQILPKTMRWIGLTFCAIGIVFLGNAVI